MRQMKRIEYGWAKFFSGYADYKEIQEGKDNVSPFEFIPWILGQCSTVGEAKKLLKISI